MPHQLEQFADAKRPNSWVLRFEGDLNITHVVELKETMLKAVTECNHLRLDCTKLSSVDLAVVQLFCSLHLSLAQHKKTLELAPPPACLIDLLNKAGFARSTGCKPECGDYCLWNGDWRQ